MTAADDEMPPPELPVFHPGEFVNYLSVTQNRWGPAKVIGIYKNADGQTDKAFYQLDIKPKALANRIRRRGITPRTALQRHSPEPMRYTRTVKSATPARGDTPARIVLQIPSPPAGRNLCAILVAAPWRFDMWF